MDNQKSPERLAHSSSGHENHKVHVCHKCGWPFPKSHPSAKQRRAHKKVCGTIEGYNKLIGIDFDGSSRSNLSDEDRLSDGDRDKTPINSKVIDVKNEVQLGKESETKQFVECGPVFEAIKTPETTTEKTQLQQSETPTTMLTHSQNEDSVLVHADSDRKKETFLDVTSPVINTLGVKNVGDLPDTIDGISNLKIPDTDVSPEVEFVESKKSVTDIVELENDANSVELPAKNEEVIENVPVVSVSDDLLVNKDGNVAVEGFKDHRVTLNQRVTSDFELEGLVGRSNHNEVPVEDDSYLSKIDANKGSNEMAKVFVGKESYDILDDTLQGNRLEDTKILVGENDIGKAVKSDISVCESVVQVHQSADSIKQDNAEKPNPISGACDEAHNQLKSVTEIGNNNGQTEESFRTITPDSAKKFSKLKGDHEIALQDIANYDKVEKVVIGAESDICSFPKEGLSENLDVAEPTKTLKDLPVENLTNSEFASLLHESDAKQGVREVTLSSKDVALSSLDNSLVQSSTAKEHISARELVDVKSGVSSESSTGKSDQQQIGSSVIDFSADSISQTDSLENNWGSVSVLSVQSDTQAIPERLQAVTGDKTDSNKNPISQSNDENSSDKPDMVEPPSFMTLVVEPGSMGNQNPSAAVDQAGWFPTVTRGPNESQGRKKNEEIIAKVTNWSAEGKKQQQQQQQQRAPLKSLLGEETQLERDWKSPAAEIKREKKQRRRRKPYWAQFMCCSSVH